MASNNHFHTKKTKTKKHFNSNQPLISSHSNVGKGDGII